MAEILELGVIALIRPLLDCIDDGVHVCDGLDLLDSSKRIVRGGDFAPEI